jgi:Tfp pilus assembly protein PilN
VAGLVSSLFEDRRRLASALTEIFRTLPPGVTLDSLAFERARSELVLRGSADSTQTVLQIVGQLERLDGVAGVELKYTTRRAGPSGERTDFELLVRQKGSS